MADPLTHFDAAGDARMVTITDKPETPRSARARARVRMGAATLARIRAGEVGKGDVLGVARLAATLGAKQTATLIPLCHPVRVTGVEVTIAVDEALPGVVIEARVDAVDRTGPEMEAMTAATTAALTVYDMCKAMDRGMVIEAVELLEKSGGKTGLWRREGG
ncbi:MAG TPA: cyclic pyranopterin monophosphate synthase MoaC [Nannocystaceae bacterium]|nr:cyclic pyranopterin monophosphate synthase MoaC [Nannocystaceae bacterium]